MCVRGVDVACFGMSTSTYLEPSLPCTVQLKSPMATLVLHYDTDPSTVCELLGLSAPDPVVGECYTAAHVAAPHVSASNIVVLVSPSNYHQRRASYDKRFTVVPLLFEWRKLTADDIRVLMHADDGTQLYMSVLLETLRRYQRDNKVAEFHRWGLGGVPSCGPHAPFLGRDEQRGCVKWVCGCVRVHGCIRSFEDFWTK